MDLRGDKPLYFATDLTNFTSAALLESNLVTSYDQIRGDLWGGFDAYLQGRGVPGRLRISRSSNGA